MTEKEMLDWAFVKGMERGTSEVKILAHKIEVQESVIKHLSFQLDGITSKFSNWAAEVNGMIDQYIERKVNERLQWIIDNCADGIEVEKMQKGIEKRSASDISIEDLSVKYFSGRLLHGLAAAGIDTLGKLADLTERKILKMDKFGKKSLEAIKKVLSDYGLELKN